MTNDKNIIGNKRLLPTLAAAFMLFIAASTDRSLGSAPIQQPADTANDATDDLVRGIALTPEVFRAAEKKIRPALVTIESFAGSSVVQGQIGGIRRQGEGNTTGVMIDPSGLVVTSAFNFIQQPRVITVITSDGKKHLARLLGRDETRQICLLEVQGVSDMPVAELADPAAVRVGQWAMSIGVGYGDVEPAVSLGIISAKNRAGGRAIQTDANISPANYGGPLIDAEGRMIGVCVPLNPNSLDKGAGVEWYDSGIGFAIPLLGLEDRLAELRAGADFYPAYLGVTVSSSTDPAGVRIESVDSVEAQRAALQRARNQSRRNEAPGSEADRQFAEQEANPEQFDYPAFDAGLQVGDVIVAIDGNAVVDTRSLRSVLTRFNAGNEVSIDYHRGDERSSLTLTLGRPPKSIVDAGPPMPGPAPGN